MVLRWTLTGLLVCFVIPLVAQDNYVYTPSDTLLNQAYEAMVDEEYESAIALFKQVPPPDSNYADALGDLIYTFTLMEEPDSALVYLEKALKKPGANRRQYLFLQAEILKQKEQYDAALATLDTALKYYPYEFSVFINRGDVYHEAGQYQKAIAEWQKAVRYNFLSPSAHLKMGATYFDHGYLTKGALCFTMGQLMQPLDNPEVIAFYEMAVKNEHELSEEAADLSDEVDFSSLDLLLRNQVALNKKYKIKSRWDEFAITRSLHLIFDQMQPKRSADDFWNTYYLPFFKGLFNQGHLDGLVAYMFSRLTDAPSIDKLVSKSEGDIKGMAAYLNSTLQPLAFERTMEWDGDVREVSLITDEEVLYAIGKLEGETRLGYWEYFHENSELASYGRYNKKGNRDGRWVWLTDDGDTSEITYFKDGNRDGELRTFYDNGALSQIVPFDDNEVEGTVVDYYYAGALFSETPFAKTQKNGTQTYYYPIGKVQAEIPWKDDKREGIMKGYYVNGQLEAEEPYKEGELDGPYREYYDDGVLYETGQFKEGKREGKWITYHHNGQIKEEITYKDGNQVGEGKEYFKSGKLYKSYDLDERGKLNGSSKTYDENGQLVREEFFDKGSFEGYRCFDKEGNLIKEATAKRKELEVELYYPNGELKVKGLMVDGERDGVWRYYYRNGQLSSVEYAQEGQMQQADSQYYASGLVDNVYAYKDDVKHGPYTSYYRNGQLFEQGWYEEGDRAGYRYWYYSNGALRQSAYYQNGQMQGPNHFYDITGNKQYTYEYDQGNLVAFTHYDHEGNPKSHQRLNLPAVTLTSTYTNGQTSYENDYVYGVQHGPRLVYNFFGEKIVEGQMYNDERHGKWTAHHINGKLMEEKEYRYGRLINEFREYDYFGILTGVRHYDSLGYRNDTTRYYYPDGKTVRIIMPFRDGERHGEVLYLAPDGTLMGALHYDEGYLLGYSYLNTDGSRKEMIALPNETGDVKCYYPNGKLALSTSFQYGARHGTYSKYATDGTLLFEGEFQHGAYNGKAKEYYVNGTLREDFTYQDDNKEGVQYLYYPNGKRSYEITYVLGQRHGEAKFYHEDGSLHRHVVYHDDDIIKDLTP